MADQVELRMAYSFRYRACLGCVGALVLACGAAAAQSGPVITSVTMTGSTGQNFGLIIQGSGFGSGPKNVTYPFYGDTVHFRFINMHPNTARPHTQEGAYIRWSAGHGSGSGADPVTLDYMIWNDTEIQFCGFYGEYGQNGFVMTSGDKFEIKISGADGATKATYFGTAP